MIPSHQENVTGEVQTPPTEKEIRAQLDRIRSSLEFDVPERARKFLCYVINETLAGRADRIKAYSIGVEVFSRDASFDAQSDPVVRIEAGRVRRALERYYLLAGQDDPVVITMPKGGYVPVFTRAERAPCLAETIPGFEGDHPPLQRNNPRARVWWPAVAAALCGLLGLAAAGYFLHFELASDDGRWSRMPDVPHLLVQPFEDLTGTPESAIIARGLTEEVIGQIARFKEITVVAGRATGGATAPASAQDLPSYALEGGVRIVDSKLRLSTRLVDRSDGAIVWADSYDENLQVRNLLQLEAHVATAVVTALAQPYGIIFRANLTRLAQTPPVDWDAYACTLSYYGYRTELNPQTHLSVQSCLKHAVERFPNYATAWALLSLTYLDEVRFHYRLNPTAPPTLNLAVDAAERAVALDPQNVRALQAQMLALFFDGEVEAALNVGARAYEINPNDTELVGEYGFRMALSGQWKSGCELMSGAVTRNPGPFGYYEAGLAVCSYMAGSYQAAEEWARIADLRNNPIYHLIRAAILGKLGKIAEAQEERQWLETNAPQLLANLRPEIARRLYRAEDQQHFIDGLTDAGFANMN